MPINLGSDAGGRKVNLSSTALTTHACVVGMTGSGKTGVVLGMTEELVRNNIPVVILDIKGDMPNIFLQDDDALMASMRPRIITPGGTHGEQVNITSGLGNPERLSESVTSLLDLVKLPSDPLTSRQHSYISAILESRHDRNQRCHLVDLVVAIQEPPFNKIGVMELDEVISRTGRKSLAAKLNNVLVAKKFANWREGIALDIKELTDTAGKVRTPVVVYSVAHLANEDERLFAQTLLLDELVSFMRKSSGSKDLKVAFIVDECFGLMPPRGNSPTKTALLSLLKMGRGVGLGVVLATQNVMDLDYRGFSNCGTWIIGRLVTANDRRRLVEGLCNSGIQGLDKGALERRVGNLKKRHFLVARGGKLVPFLSREVSCALTGPMDPTAVEALVPKTPIQQFTGKLVNLFKRDK